MTIQDHVVDLELGQKLVKAGIIVDSMWKHYACEIEEDGLAWWTIAQKEPRKGKKVREYLQSVGRLDVAPAPIATELMELLPERITHDDLGEPMEYGNFTLTIQKVGLWEVGYTNANQGQMPFDSVEDKNIANALAKMLLYLKNSEIFK